eukprot:gene11119-3180_t
MSTLCLRLSPGAALLQYKIMSSAGPETQLFKFDLSDVRVEDNLPELNNQEFVNFYDAYEKSFVEIIRKECFDEVGTFWKQQWSSTKCFNHILKSQDGQRFCKLRDAQIFQRVLEELLPDVLQRMDTALTKSIRSFSKNLQPWIAEAVKDLPTNVAEQKIRDATLFSQRVRRYSGLNHLAQAARNLLSDHSHLTSLIEDYMRVDIDALISQVCWSKFEQEFQAVLQGNKGLPGWCEWLQLITKAVLPSSASIEALMEAASDICRTWSVVSSLLIRDLTLRSAPTFGMFHLMRLFCDEYLLYLVEHIVSKNNVDAVPFHKPDGGIERKSLARSNTTQCIEEGTTKRIKMEAAFDDGNADARLYPGRCKSEYGGYTGPDADEDKYDYDDDDDCDED